MLTVSLYSLLMYAVGVVSEEMLMVLGLAVDPSLHCVNAYRVSELE